MSVLSYIPNRGLPIPFPTNKPVRFNLVVSTNEMVYRP